MAYTIKQNFTSNKFYPTSNPITGIVNSSNSGNCNFRYVADIYINGVKLSTPFKAWPDPTTSDGIFDFTKIIDDYISDSIPKQPYTNYFNAASSTTAPAAVFSFYVKYGEEYDSSVDCSGTITSYLNQGTSNTAYAYHGAFDYEDWLSYDYTDYAGVWASASNPISFMTKSPRDIPVTYNDPYYLDVIAINPPTTYSSAGVGYVALEVVRYYKDGSQAENNFNPPSITSCRRYRLAVGPWDLNDITNQCFISQYVKYYTVRLVWRVGTNNIHALSETFTFTLKKPTEFATRFGWINQLGGIDAYTYYHRNKKTYDVIRSVFRKSMLRRYGNEWTYQVGDRQVETYNIEVTQKHQVSTYVEPGNASWIASDFGLSPTHWVYDREDINGYEMFREDSTPTSRMLLKACADHGIVAGDSIFVLPTNTVYNTGVNARYTVVAVEGNSIDIGVTYNNFTAEHRGYFYKDAAWRMLPIQLTTTPIPELQKTGKKLLSVIDYATAYDKITIS